MPESISKKFAIISLLTVLFLFDEVLIYLLLEQLYDWELHPLILAGGAIVVVGLNASLAVIVYKLLRRKPSTGDEGMIGQIGVAVSRIRGEGRIKVRGEIWKAESSDVIKAGEKVVIDGMSGLTLRVSRLKNDSE